MDFNYYQEKTEETAIYPNKGEIGGLMYVALGLAGEAGEIANKVKKLYRDGDKLLPIDIMNNRTAIAKEAGDVLWYLARLLGELNVEFDDVAQGNLNKLFDRKERGVLGGSGDNR